VDLGVQEGLSPLFPFLPPLKKGDKGGFLKSLSISLYEREESVGRGIKGVGP
jgi:hypothetical protein